MKNLSFFVVFAMMSVSVIGLGCGNSLILRLYGVHKPKIETVSSIESFLSEYGIDPEHVLYPKDSVAFYTLLQTFSKFPGVYIFNGDGLLVRHLDKDECVHKNEVILANDLKWVNEAALIEPQVSLEHVNALAFNHALQDHPISINPDKVTIVITFAKWLGKRLNQTSFDFYKESDKVNNNVFLLDFDIMDFLGVNPKEIDFST